jgi:glycosyltransferase involved in cell wall biosynthesis
MVERSPYAQDIVTTGFVPRAHLGALLRGARAVVFPSFYEGFGLPVAEALACGTPVVASAIPPHFEVAGSAAAAVFFVDPMNVTDITRGLLEITNNATHWKEVALAKGPERAKDFSWTALGGRTATVLRGLPR